MNAFEEALRLLLETEEPVGGLEAKLTVFRPQLSDHEKYLLKATVAAVQGRPPEKAVPTV